MAIGFEQALGIHENALKFRGQRSAVLANNLANADTPNFKARDIQFEDVLRTQATDKHSHQKHIALGIDDLLYEVPGQPSIDGNTVETHVEQGRFAENALRYQASFTFLNSKMKGLMTALRGE